MGKVASCSFGDDENIIILHLETAILTLGKDKAVSLAVHGLGAESTSNEIDITFSELGEAFRELEHLNLDTSVLLGSDTFARGTIVISTRLSLGFGEDCVSLAELDFVVGLEVSHLPSDELVVVWVLSSGDETTAPVSVQTESQKIFLTSGWEELEPVVGVLELRDLRLSDVDLHENLVLGKGGPDLVFRCGFLLSFSRLVAACGSGADLARKTDSS